MDSPRRELSNNGLGIVVTLLVCWQIDFFVRLCWRSNSAVARCARLGLQWGDAGRHCLCDIVPDNTEIVSQRLVRKVCNEPDPLRDLNYIPRFLKTKTKKGIF